MKRVWGHGLTGLLLLVGVAGASAGGPACVHDDSTIFVSDVLAPQFVTAGMACTFTADPTQAVLGQGTFDAALALEYKAVFLVGNQLVPRGDPNQPNTETSFVSLAGAVVRIVDSTGTQLITYTQPVAGTIPPSSGTTPGYLSVGVTIIDNVTASSLGVGVTDHVVSYVRFFGKTVGGESVESNEFGFPVDVCRGCLVSFPVAEDDPNQRVQPNCGLAGAAASSTASSVPCFIGQDLPVDCSVCVVDNPLCQTRSGASLTIVDAGGGG
jgi:hypothetical protein